MLWRPDSEDIIEAGSIYDYCQGQQREGTNWKDSNIGIVCVGS